MDKFPIPKFRRQLVEDFRQDGYWIEAVNINGDSKPDIIGYGLGQGEVSWYRNNDWKKTLIAKYLGPVGMHHTDVNGDGRNDIVICYQYGQTMVNCDPEGGKIVWLENPGNCEPYWKSHYIGRATSMHRLKVGYFTQSSKLQVLALPIVGRPNDVHSITPTVLFTQPDDLYGAKEWKEERLKIYDKKYYDEHKKKPNPNDGDGRLIYFHVIHGVSIKKYGNKFGSNLDSALIASEEGITWIYFSPEDNVWYGESLGTGEMSQVNKTGFKGSGNVDVGKVGDDAFAYIPTVEPFHGNTVAVYYKREETNESKNSLTGCQWERVVLDVYDNPNPIGEGPGHFVICADFDNDGDDEFLVALRGPMPWQGVFYYKAIDVKNGVFAKWRVSSDSAARIAVADFNGDGRLDFATIGYSVAGYYTAENPSIVVYYNDFAPYKDVKDSDSLSWDLVNQSFNSPSKINANQPSQTA